MQIMEIIFVVTLFLLYLGLWKAKQVNQLKNTGINPKVMAHSISSIQKYMNQLMNILTSYAIVI